MTHAFFYEKWFSKYCMIHFGNAKSQNEVNVFSRRFSSEKSPIITVTSFFTTDLIVYVPLFTDFTRSRVLVSTVFTRFTVNPAVTGSSPCLSQKPFRTFFFGTVRLFQFFGTVRLRIFFAFKVSHLQVFVIFCSKLKCQKAPRLSLFMYFGTMRRFKILIFRFFSKIKKNEFFLSSKGPPFNLFDILQQTGFSKNPKGPVFTGLKTALFEPQI